MPNSSARITVSPFSLSLYKLIHSDTIVHFPYRIRKNHVFALIYVILTGTEHRLLVVVRLM
ncbi:hypothetical protein CEW81_17075 [Kluyvera genomosp. 3]|uniref:Uncharacterized protein n=1 Tax=Kluyvera genomosp. 3 TaxID=2774055 RepID=A0A248KL55_9ENTR|nr:hypothetical protein CEW81_17075 [Kluyvera genomosp. 3]